MAILHRDPVVQFSPFHLSSSKQGTSDSCGLASATIAHDHDSTNLVMARLCQAWFRSGDINPMAIRQEKASNHLQKKVVSIHTWLKDA
jgi:hypothetical protein